MAFLSKKSIYGLKAMYILSLNAPTKLQAKIISQEGDIPFNFLEQILTLLKKDRLVKSVRGAKGGYTLAKESSQIKVLDILNCLEACVSCIETDQNDLLLSFWEETQNKLDGIFSLSLEDLVKQNQKGMMFCI